MIADYDSLLAEDAVWSEPTEAEFDRLTSEGKARYWLHHLRDANVKQFSDPGRCLVTWQPTLPCSASGPDPWRKDSEGDTHLARRSRPNERMASRAPGW